MSTELSRLAPLYNPQSPHGRMFSSTGTERLSPTMTREEVIFRMSTRMALEGRVYSSKECAELMNNYPPSLFIRSNTEEVTRNGYRNANPQDVNDTLSYILPRFLAQEHIPLVNGADIKLTDNEEAFFGTQDSKYKPKDRSRTYSIHTDEKTGKTEITYLLRHNIPENYTDLLEMISFVGIIEAARQTRDVLLDQNKTVGVKSINILDTTQPMTLSASRLGFLPPWKVRGERHNKSGKELFVPSAMQDVMDKLKTEMNVQGISVPHHIMFGNDFSVPLVIATGLLTEDEFQAIIAEGGSAIVTDEQLSKLKKDEDKILLKQFSALQYLNRYTGSNSRLNQLQRRVNTKISSIRKQLLAPTYTALGSTVDIIDFSNLDTSTIKAIPNAEIREIINKLKVEKFSYFSLPYPLGDSISGLIQAFEANFDIAQDGYSFFGKVGAVHTKGQSARKGRVVMPSQALPIFGNQEDIIPINNPLKPEDAVIIPAADDTIDTAVAANAVTLENKSDFTHHRRVRNEKKMPAELFLDMESYWYNQVCQYIGKNGPSIYYVSDVTEHDPFNPYASQSQSSDEITTMAVTLGTAGAFAAAISPMTILKYYAKSQ